MAIMVACVDVLDSDSNSLVPNNADGTRPLFKLAVGATLGATVTVSGDTAIVELGVNSAGALAAASLALSGNLAVGGTITQGPKSSTTGTASTTGSSSDVLLTLPLANNSASTLELTLIGYAVALPAVWRLCASWTYADVTAGVLTPTPASAPIEEQTFGLPPSLALSWLAGVLTATVTGPRVHITGTANSGGTATLITVSEDLTNDLTGLSVTIAGASGTPGLNGAHVATYVSANVFSVAVVFVSNDASGTAVLTSNPAVAWSASASLVVSPAP